MNSDCAGMSFCCSKGKCVESVICTMGFKQYNDNCDFRYECGTRCCHDKTHTCTDPSYCHETCLRNQDCKISSCCSNNQCVQSVICLKKQKISGDYCDTANECIDGFCFRHTCDQKKSQNVDNIVSDGVLMVVTILIIIVAIGFWLKNNSLKKVRRNSNRDKKE